jgi:hypothetical protein
MSEQGVLDIRWEELGLKAAYETGELIIIQAPSVELFPQAPTLFLLSADQKNLRVRLEPKQGPGSVVFYEFYASQSGTYSLQAPWGSFKFEVQQREQLGFALEFGIFFTVVSFLVGAMAWKYLIRGRRS